MHLAPGTKFKSVRNVTKGATQKSGKQEGRTETDRECSVCTSLNDLCMQNRVDAILIGESELMPVRTRSPEWIEFCF